MSWFPEPPEPDTTIGPADEHFVKWLARSTSRNAASIRAFLNRNLDALPEEHREPLVRRMSADWSAAVFEVIVARTLALLGGSVEFEPPSSRGSRVDFRAEFIDGVVHVEATAPIIDRAIGAALQQQYPLYDVIAKVTPPGWVFAVEELPAIGPNDSRKTLRHVLEQGVASRAERGEPFTVDEVLDCGTIRVRFQPSRSTFSGPLYGPIAPAFSDAEASIAKAVEGKKKQLRAVERPRIVAVNAGGISSEIEDFDRALFGRSVMVLDEKRQLSATGFDSCGILAQVRKEPPVIDAVLAYVRAGFWDLTDPVLYRHPRSEAELPSSLLELEQRTLPNRKTGIDIRVARRRNILVALSTDEPETP